MKKFSAKLLGALSALFIASLPLAQPALAGTSDARPLTEDTVDTTFSWTVEIDQATLQWMSETRELNANYAFQLGQISEETLGIIFTLATTEGAYFDAMRCVDGDTSLQVDGYCWYPPVCSELFEPSVCGGLSSATLVEEYSMFAYIQDFRAVNTCMSAIGDDYSMEQLKNCTEASGCEWFAGEAEGDMGAGPDCPYVALGSGPTKFKINPADFGGILIEDPSPSPTAVETPSPSPTPTEPELDLITAREASETSFTSPSSFSSLQGFGPPERVIERFGIAAAASLVLIILVALPTQLINSTLSSSRGPLRALFIGFGGRFRRLVPRGALKLIPANKYLEGLIVFLIASIIAGFSDSNFGLNEMSLRILITSFMAFVIVNLVGTVLVRALFRNRLGLQLPTIRAHYGYLILLAVTVLISRIIGLEPAVVFGSVLTIEFARVVASAAQNSEALQGRLLYMSSTFTLALGLAGWLAYSTIDLARAQPELPAGLIWVFSTELLATITIQSLVAMPILLLPLKFMAGGSILKWSKLRWAFSFFTSIVLFVAVLIPLPESWETTAAPIATWSLVLVGYSLFSVALWAFFAYRKKLIPAKSGQRSTD